GCRCRMSMNAACASWPRSSAPERTDRKSTRLNSSHTVISYAVFCLKKKQIMEFRSKYHSRTISVPRGEHGPIVWPHHHFYDSPDCPLHVFFKVGAAHGFLPSFLTGCFPN